MTNKIYGCLMIFFVANAIEGQLISTGAFEIQFNGEWLFYVTYIESKIDYFCFVFCFSAVGYLSIRKFKIKA